jgi:hypothetical protein
MFNLGRSSALPYRWQLVRERCLNSFKDYSECLNQKNLEFRHCRDQQSKFGLCIAQADPALGKASAVRCSLVILPSCASRDAAVLDREIYSSHVSFAGLVCAAEAVMIAAAIFSVLCLA